VTPLNVTVLSPWISPKLVPVTTTLVFTGPEEGESFRSTGITRKDAALLAILPDVTITSAKPGKSAPGTGATIFVSDQEAGVVEMPPIVTVLPLADAPNPLPLIVREEPTGLTGPTVGEMLLILGDAHAEIALKNTTKKTRAVREKVFIDT
jgi:hypothetical protein